jgi:hypothetical protein
MPMRRANPILASLVMAVLCVSAAASSPGTPVLGKKNLLSGGIGWGTAQPAVIFNGGDPSGRAYALRWTGWGNATAYAYGLNPIFKPQGGYYREPGRIELRAYRIARCVPGGPTAYTRLEARVAGRPGGPLGKWFAWGGWKTLCTWPS